MCNLYSLTKGQQAIRDLFRVVHDRIGNMDYSDTPVFTQTQRRPK